MATPFRLRQGTGDFNYVNHDLRTDNYVMAGPDYERPGVNTCIHSRKYWRKKFPELVKHGYFERVTGKAARKWRKSENQ